MWFWMQDGVKSVLFYGFMSSQLDSKHQRTTGGVEGKRGSEGVFGCTAWALNHQDILFCVCVCFECHIVVVSDEDDWNWRAFKDICVFCTIRLWLVRSSLNPNKRIKHAFCVNRHLTSHYSNERRLNHHGLRAPMSLVTHLMKPLSYPVLVIILLQQRGVVGALQHSQQPLLPLP